MSNIPEVPLWTACTINDEVIPESTTPEYEFEYVDISSVSQGRVSDNLELQIFESAPSRARRLARPGDVLVSTVRTYLRAIAPVEHEGRVYSTGFAVLRALEGVSDPRFLNHMMASMPVIEDIRIRSTGVSYPAITPTELARIRVPLPPLEEQRRIADHLDAETAQIDGMMAELDELVRILDVRRVEAVAQAVHLTEVDEELPAGWIRMPMKYAVIESFTGEWGDDAGVGEVDVQCVRVADFDRATRTVGQDEIPTIRSLPASKASAKALRPNDLLVERSGGTAVNPVGNVVLYVGPEGAVSSNFIECVRVDEAHHDPRYWWLLQYAAYRTGFTHTHVRQTTGIQNLDARGFFSEPMPVPGLSEQRRVVAEVEASMARVDEMLADARRLKDLLIERRAALITDVITGKKEAA
ncbi:restriction endonuclease subunit S [Micrococcus luteus]|nr:restriction endonuclease subunit S [Micrococcus luteus]